jgi:hypothetical protein
MLTIPEAAKMYRIPLTDFGPEGWGEYPCRRGVLVSSGAGIMSAVMDQVPFRYCVDTDELRGRLHWLADFMLMAYAVDPMLGVCGWFSYTDPEPLRAALEALPFPAPCYFGNVRVDLPKECVSLYDFVTACWARYDASKP